MIGTVFALTEVRRMGSLAPNALGYWDPEALGGPFALPCRFVEPQVIRQHLRRPTRYNGLNCSPTLENGFQVPLSPSRFDLWFMAQLAKLLGRHRVFDLGVQSGISHHPVRGLLVRRLSIRVLDKGRKNRRTKSAAEGLGNPAWFLHCNNTSSSFGEVILLASSVSQFCPCTFLSHISRGKHQ